MAAQTTTATVAGNSELINGFDLLNRRKRDDDHAGEKAAAAAAAASAAGEETEEDISQTMRDGVFDVSVSLLF